MLKSLYSNGKQNKISVLQRLQAIKISFAKKKNTIEGSNENDLRHYLDDET